MYINFWYPIVRSEDLSYDIPAKVRVLGVDASHSAIRMGTLAYCSNTCTHRGASLSSAWFQGNTKRSVDGCVVCPYHGWEFNGDGECINVRSSATARRHLPAPKVMRHLWVQEKVRHRVCVPRRLSPTQTNARSAAERRKSVTSLAWRGRRRAGSRTCLAYYERSIENGHGPGAATSSCTRPMVTQGVSTAMKLTGSTRLPARRPSARAAACMVLASARTPLRCPADRREAADGEGYPVGQDEDP